MGMTETKPSTSLGFVSPKSKVIIGKGLKKSRQNAKQTTLNNKENIHKSTYIGSGLSNLQTNMMNTIPDH